MKKKIAFTFPHLHAFGGGEIFCEYLTNYLINYFNIDLYYYRSNKINSKIKFDRKINIIAVKSSSIIVDFFCKNYIFLGHLYLLYILNKKKYHFIFSGAGEFFHKTKCFQYIHHPFYSLNVSHYLSLGLKKKNIFKIILRFFVSLIARTIIFINNKSYKKTVTIVNSSFINNRFTNIYKKKLPKPKIIYPTFKIPKPIKENFTQFEKRKNDFIILGRVSRDKNTLEAVNFFIEFKKNFENLNLGNLHIIGPIEKNIQNKVKAIGISNKDCFFHGYLSLDKRDKILKQSKYGIHFFRGEHFGRSVLEMQKLGMIVFCHNSGGAMEIVASNLQKFNSEHDLEEKVKLVLLKIDLRKKIKKMISVKIKKFSDEKFKKDIIKLLQYG
tara:strand:- start:3656 stop:4804 length:1149 start_codon:yes stop_codon:yes gene_type:complete